MQDASHEHTPQDRAEPAPSVPVHDRPDGSQFTRFLRSLLATSKALLAADHHSAGGVFRPLVHVDRED